MAKQTSDEIVSLFFSAGRIFRQKIQILCPSHNFSPAQLEVMRFIFEKEKVTMKDVADFLAITPPSATVMVEHLVKTKMLSRKESKKDRRAVFLSLTSKGKKTLSQIIKERQIKLKKILSNLNHKEQLSFLNILRKIFKS
jgi:DNA-binding MarR family transcriptional regulator